MIMEEHQYRVPNSILISFLGAPTRTVINNYRREIGFHDDSWAFFPQTVPLCPSYKLLCVVPPPYYVVSQADHAERRTMNRFIDHRVMYYYYLRS